VGGFSSRALLIIKELLSVNSRAAELLLQHPFKFTFLSPHHLTAALPFSVNSFRTWTSIREIYHHPYSRAEMDPISLLPLHPLPNRRKVNPVAQLTLLPVHI
jgi:hypothetical protein